MGSMLDVTTFPYNQDLGCYEGAAAVAGSPVSVHLYDGAISDPNILNGRLSAAMHIVSTRYEELVSAIVAELFELKNESWIDEPGEMVTEARFRSNLSIKAVSIPAAGGFELEWADSDMFWGHAVVVWLDEAGRITRVDIAG